MISQEGWDVLGQFCHPYRVRGRHVAKLVNPQAALAFQMDGADSHHLGIRIPPAFASAEAAGEIPEDYWLALTRDVPI
jgi:hypothetical protein